MKISQWWKLSSDESKNSQRSEKEWCLVTFRLWRCLHIWHVLYRCTDFRRCLTKDFGQIIHYLNDLTWLDHHHATCSPQSSNEWYLSLVTLDRCKENLHGCPPPHPRSQLIFFFNWSHNLQVPISQQKCEIWYLYQTDVLIWPLVIDQPLLIVTFAILSMFSI